MRSTRAYVAGFGTSGSLLAGAAALFLLASAIVGFRGWPQIGTGSAHSYVSGPAVPVASRTARRLTAALRARRVLVAARTARTDRPLTTPTSGGRGGPARGGSGPTYAGGVAGAGTPRRGATAASTPASGGGSGPGSCSGSCSGEPQSLVVSLTNSAAQTVSNVGSTMGDQITGTAQSAGSQVSGISPAAGTTVSNAGATAGGSLSGAASTGASAISTAGNALGGGH